MNKFIKNVEFSFNKWSKTFEEIGSLYYILFFVIFNSIFKFWFLGGESIWADEGYSMFYAQQSLSNIMEISIHDQNPPLFLSLLHYWLKIFGVNVFAAKAFSVFLSILTAIALFLFSEKFLNKKTAILVSIIFLFSSTQLYYAHEARTFTLVEFLCVLSFWFYMEILLRPRLIKVFGYAIIGIAMLMSHYLSVFVLLSQFVCSFLFLFKNRKGFWYQFCSFVLLGLIFLPWLPVLARNIPENGKGWLLSPSLNQLYYALDNLADGKMLRYLYSGIIASTLVIILFKKVKLFFVQDFKVSYFLILVSWLIIPVMVDYIVSQYTPVFLTRYLLYASLGLLLSIAYIFTHLRTDAANKAMIILLIVGLQIHSFKFKPEKPEDWNIMVPKITKIKDDKTLTIISAWYQNRCFAYYYNKDFFTNYDSTTQLLANDNVFAMNDPSSLKNQDLSKVEKIIFVKSHYQLIDPENSIGQYIENHDFNVLSEYSVNGIITTVYYNNLFHQSDSIYKTTILVKRQNCELWDMKKTENQITKDVSIVYFSDLEIDSTCPAYTKLSNRISFSGHLSNKVDNQNEYGISFEKNTTELKGFTSISANLEVYRQSSEPSKAKLCVSIQSSYKTIFWKEFPLNDFIENPDSWFKCIVSTTIPSKLPRGNKLKVFVWNPDEKPLYVDDIEVTLGP